MTDSTSDKSKDHRARPERRSGVIDRRIQPDKRRSITDDISEYRTHHFEDAKVKKKWYEKIFPSIFR